MKNGKISLDKLILIILAILALLALLMFIFKVDILEVVRNLPQYDYEKDRLIDYTGVSPDKIAGVCPKGGEVIATIGNPKSISDIIDNSYILYNLNQENKEGEAVFAETLLYWQGQRENAQIILEKKGFFGLEANILIAKVDNEGNIKVESLLLNKDSEFYQKKRFSSEVVNEYLLLPKLDKSYLGSQNKICKQGAPTELTPAWPGENVITAHPKVDFEGKKLRINFEPYIEFVEGSMFRFFYLVDEGDYLEIRGEVSGLDKVDIGRIYPDGSVWFDIGILEKPGFLSSRPGAKIGESETGQKVIVRDNQYYPPYHETNIRVDNYDYLKKIL